MAETKKISHGLIIISYSLLVVLLFFAPTRGQSQIPITLTWSTNTYVPLDYQGKALPSRGSQVEVVANIDTPGYNPQDLFYNWFIDDKLQKENSGQGQSIFQFDIGNRIGRNYLIKSEIKNKAGQSLGISPYISIKSIEPEIVLESQMFPLEISKLKYKYHVLDNQEIDFVAQPYFFDIKTLNDLNYTWSFGGKIASLINQENPNILTLKIGQVETQLKQLLNLRVDNKNNPLQQSQATAEITIIPSL